MVARKRKLSVSIDVELIDWILSQVKKRRFASISHGFEFAISKLKEEEEEEEN